MRIKAVRVTPIAFRDPPLLNVTGVHEPWTLHRITEVELDNGLIGLDFESVTSRQRKRGQNRSVRADQ